MFHADDVVFHIADLQRERLANVKTGTRQKRVKDRELTLSFRDHLRDLVAGEHRLALILDEWKIDEVVIPLDRESLLTILIDGRSNDHLDHLDIVRDGLRILELSGSTNRGLSRESPSTTQYSPCVAGSAPCPVVSVKSLLIAAHKRR